MKTINLHKISLSFLSNKDFREFQQLERYYRLMAVHKKAPKFVHISPEFYASVARAYPDFIVYYQHALVKCSDPDKMKEIISRKSTKNMKKQVAADFKNL